MEMLLVGVLAIHEPAFSDDDVQRARASLGRSAKILNRMLFDRYRSWYLVRFLPNGQ